MAKIKQIKDNIITVEGKEKFKLYQFFQLSKDVQGFVLSAKDNEAKLLVNGSTINLKMDSEVSAIADKDIEVKSSYFGKIITPSGEIVHSESEDKEPSKVLGKSTLFNSAPAIIDRKGIDAAYDTGILAIDTMIPIGRGQRELIIGDRVTGKSTIALNAIINSAKTTKTIYVAIGQKKTNVIQAFKTLHENKASESTIIIYANPDSAAEQFLAPMIGAAMAEALAYKGEDVVVIFDDLTKHANVYREISLSIDRNPGREAYPNDIFYIHSRLLERGGRFNEFFNNGSITMLPIVETVESDIASLIPSNIISITDGQIFTNTEKFNKGEFPAIDVQMSVSRTGSVAQSKILRFASKGLKADHARFDEIRKFSEMSIDISDDLSKQISKSKQLDKILLQYGNVGYSREVMVALIFMYKTGILEGDFSMRELSHVLKLYLSGSPVGKSIKKQLNEIDSDNEARIASYISYAGKTIIDAFEGNFGKSVARVELEKLRREK